MEDKKSIFLSKTFWGVILTAAATLIPKLGLPSDTSGVAQQIVAAIGAAFAIYGRIKATKTIG